MKKVFLFLASCLVAFAASAETYSVTIKYSQLSWNQNAAGDMEAIITLPSISFLRLGDIVNFTLTGGNSNIPFYNIAIVDNADQEYDYWHELSRWDDYLEINSSGTGTVPIFIHDDCWGSDKIVACLVYPPTYDYIIKNGLIYDIKDGNNVCLRGCSNSVTSGEISIPTALSFKGVTYTVTSIGDNAFRGRGITSLTIPNSVLEIGNYAFAKCSDLTSIAIPEGVTTIGEYAFEDVRTVIYSGNAAGRPWGARAVIATVDGNYEYVDIEKSIIHKYIGNEKNVKIPSNVSMIGDNAFRNCTSITSITIPNSVLGIGYSAFSGCSNLTSITIPNSVLEIGYSAFSGCSNLTSITIPNSVLGIGYSAFSGCSNLTSITIPNSVLEIGYSAFSGCSNLTSITIPNSVTSIDYYAFEGCEKLISIVIPNNVTTIGGSAFSGCTNLKSLVIGEKVESIGENAFNGCSSLSKITCYAVEPPTVDASSFSNYNGYLTIPCDNFEAYDIHSVWGTFKHVDCIGAETVELTKDEVAVVPEKTEAVFSMPKNEDANSYTLTISNNGVTFCSLTFNAQGQLANIDFSTNKSYELKSGVEAFQFTVTGLSTAEDYGYSFKALASNKSVLKEYSGSFTTKNEDGTGGSVQGGGEGSGQGGQGGSTAVSEVSNATAVTIVNGQILVNGEAPAFVVTVSGKKIANANLKAGVYFVVADGNSVSVVVR